MLCGRITRLVRQRSTADSILSPLKAMSRLALSRGHGSTMWVTSFVATELPPLSAMVSRRSRYSEQPASVANKTASASLAATLLNGCIGTPSWHVEHVAGERLIAGGGDAHHDRRHRAAS